MAFPASRGHTSPLPHGPLPPSSKPGTLHLLDHSSVVSSPSDSQPIWERITSVKEPCEEIGPTWIIQDSLPSQDP